MMMNNVVNNNSPLWRLCDYLLSWTMRVYENAAGKMSPEVYDRAVSAIGIVVPLLLLAAALGAFLVVLGKMWSGVRK